MCADSSWEKRAHPESVVVENIFMHFIYAPLYEIVRA